MKRPLLLTFALCLSLGFAHAAIEPPRVPEKNTVARFGAAVAEGAKVRVASRADPAAITGNYAVADRDWLTVAQAPLPAEGDLLHIWIRYRSLALQMKTRLEPDAKLTEFPWNWTRNANRFDWHKVGSFTRDELGPEVYFMTDPKYVDDSGVDGLVITTDGRWSPTRR
ncbi:MAG: hypothetical protein ABII82_20300 [Verrucomicrobiota bacterium]